MFRVIPLLGKERTSFPSTTPSHFLEKINFIYLRERTEQEKENKQGRRGRTEEG